MIHEIREKNLFQTIKQSAKEIGYKTVGAYAFMAVLFLVISVTFVLTQHQQDIRQHAAGNFPLLTVTGVSISHSSAKIKYNSVAGASDYRVYDITDPNNVKYAGLVHPGGQTSPATEVEWNTLLDNLPHTLIVEAVDTLGPVPPGNQYTSDNIAKVNPLPAGAMLGSNAGTTPDGKKSTNGQGPSTNSPNVIAQSQPFVVQANQNFLSIPSSPNATQIFFDTFDNNQAGTLTQTVAPDLSSGTMRYTLNAGTDKAWDIYYTDADVKNSMPFIKNGHFMDMLFDGGTPGSNNPLHQTYAAMFMSPQKSVDFSNGQILHLTMDVDGHTDSRRWVDFQLSPADDPITSGRGNVNKTDLAMFFNPSSCQAEFMIGTGGTFAGQSSAQSEALFGAAGQAPIYCGNDTLTALDNKNHFDIFMSTKHIALFEDGKLIVEGDIPNGWLLFNKAKVYFTHYVYHTENEVNELISYAPYETYWINEFPYSDERHWDNMGFEVLPASLAPTGSWSSFSNSLVKVPPSTAPVFTTSTTIPTPPPLTISSVPSPPPTFSPSATPPPPTPTLTPQTALSTLSLSPANSLIVGQTYTVQVQINTNGQLVNGVQTDINYPANMLSVVSISNTNGTFDVEAQKTFSNGVIHLAYGATIPQSGNLLVATITFKALTAGSAAVSFQNASIISSVTNTNVLKNTIGATYNILTPTPTPSPTPTPTTVPVKPGDTNGDNKIDIQDLSYLLTNWGKSTAPLADFNHDGTVDITDLSTLLTNWGK